MLSLIWTSVVFALASAFSAASLCLWLRERGIRCTLEWNSGGHFKDAELRTAKAFSRVIEMQKKIPK